jgi:hypothetical protein
VSLPQGPTGVRSEAPLTDAHFTHAEQESWRCRFCGGRLGGIRWTTHWTGDVVHTTTIMCEDCQSHHFIRDGAHAWEPGRLLASGTETREGEDRNGLRAQHDGPAPKGDAR